MPNIRPGGLPDTRLVASSELWALGFLAAVQGVALSSQLAPLDSLVTAALTALLVMGAYAAARRFSGAIWTPLFWFRVSTAVFFGFGSLAQKIASPMTLIYMKALHSFSELEIIKLDTVVVFGSLTVLMTAYLVDRLLASRVAAARDAPRPREISLFWSGIAFYTAGSIVKYTILLPHDLGWSTVTVSGLVSNISALSYAGVFLISAWVSGQKPAAWPLVVALVVVETGLGILTFNKQQALTPLLVASLGFLINGVTLRRVTIAVAAIAITFSILQPMVAYARMELVRHHGVNQPASLSERASYVASYFDIGETGRDRTGVQPALSRLSYVGTATLVIAQYDNGAPGRSFENAWVALVPRFLWPNKPVTTGIGQELAESAIGVRGFNSISPGWFADSYWNFGWWGLLLVMVPVGGVLAMLSKYSLRVMRSHDWAAMPVVFLGMEMGTRVAGFIQTDVFGALPIMVGYLLAMRIAASLVRSLVPSVLLTTGAVAAGSRTPKASAW